MKALIVSIMYAIRVKFQPEETNGLQKRMAIGFTL
jgi:hypothetical protein